MLNIYADTLPITLQLLPLSRCHKEGRALIIVANKADLVIDKGISALDYAKVKKFNCTSAATLSYCYIIQMVALILLCGG